MLSAAAFVNDWIDAFNNDIERLANEIYTPNPVVNGRAISRADLLAIEQRVLAAAPQRKADLIGFHEAGDVIVVEGALTDPGQGPRWKLPFCAVLRVVDGKVTHDNTYTDWSRWPGMS